MSAEVLAQETKPVCKTAVPKMTCCTCGLETRQLHSDPWQCIAALKDQMRLHEDGYMAVMESVRRMVHDPTDDGLTKILDEGERSYWLSVLARMKEALAK